VIKILDELLEQMPADPAPVRNVLAGAHWTTVCSHVCGMASTLMGEGPHGGPQVPDAGDLCLKSAQELARRVLSDELLDASIGMAALNSQLHIEGEPVVINAADVLARHGNGKNIAVVGHFPFVDRLRPLARNLWVIEKRPAQGDLPEKAAEEFLPQADVIAITGTAFINHTIEGLLRLCPSKALVMVLGPSTPLSKVLFDYGVDILSGARVVDEAAALTSIQQGASLPQVRGVRLVTYTAPGFKG